MTDLRVVGGEVVLPDASIVAADIEVRDGRIARVVDRGGFSGEEAAGEVLDVSGCVVAPGLIDVQINGGWGHDFTANPASIRQVAAMLPRTGVTAFVPTVVTSPAAQRSAALTVWAALTPDRAAAQPIGLHFEGPAIRRRGAHDAAFVGMPDDAELERWSRANGVVLATVAPEVDGASELIARLVAQGVVVSIGHTGCTVEQFVAARRAGATAVTHLFNAMAPFDHRNPGPIGATLADGDVRAGLICDGIHLDPTTVRMAWRSLGWKRVVLVTDAISALGLETTSARLGSVTVTIGPTGVRTPDGTLAGSVLRLDDAVRNLMAMTGCTFGEAVGAASTTPAALLGLADRGRIEVGARADLAVFDARQQLERTIIGGVTAWRS